MDYMDVPVTGHLQGGAPFDERSLPGERTGSLSQGAV